MPPPFTAISVPEAHHAQSRVKVAAPRLAGPAGLGVGPCVGLAGMPPSENPSHTAAALREGLDRGEIAVRYQPVVRLSDRRPVMVEALARWLRPQAPVPPEAFVALAERAGLMRALSIIVASRAAIEMSTLCGQLKLGLSLNLPLALLLQDDLTSWLNKALAGSNLRPSDVALELTETMVAEDLALLRRALLRLRRAGFRVLLDDLVLDDTRDRLLHLPFAAFKLDRSLVLALPESARARRQVLGLVKRVRQQGGLVIAEGVSDLRLWSAVRGLGVHHAQGFIVGRPLTAEALPAWWASWRGRRPA